MLITSLLSPFFYFHVIFCSKETNDSCCGEQFELQLLHFIHCNNRRIGGCIVMENPESFLRQVVFFHFILQTLEQLCVIFVSNRLKVMVIDASQTTVTITLVVEKIVLPPLVLVHPSNPLFCCCLVAGV